MISSQGHNFLGCDKINNIKCLDIIYCIFIFATALFMRLYNIALLPLSHDEEGYAQCLLKNPELWKKIFGIPIQAILYLGIFPYKLKHLLINWGVAPAYFELEDFVYSTRFQSAIIGAGTVLLLYILARQIYGRKTGMISSVILCFLPWHIIHSRTAESAIWVPFFGCLIFISLFQVKYSGSSISVKVMWFFAACFFLCESAVKYQLNMLFIPIFFLSAIFINFKLAFFSNRLGWLCLIGALLLAFFGSSFSHIILTSKDQFLENFYRAYQKNIFQGNLFFNLFTNIKNNFSPAFNCLFFDFHNRSILYGQALRAPLLINPIIFVVIMWQIFISACDRRAENLVILLWLLIGFFGGVAGVNFFQDRYMLIILPPAMIFIGRFIEGIFSKSRIIKGYLRKYFFFVPGLVLFFGLIGSEVCQWGEYLHAAPFDLDECRNNSSGCKEAAEFLLRLSDRKDSVMIMLDDRMTVDLFLNFYLFQREGLKYCAINDSNKRIIAQKKDAYNWYYILWAPESHDPYSYDYFRQKCPLATQIKTIYYPNGMPAIYIFKLNYKPGQILP